jgi:uncharacterized protein YndB with AHSA1/START domain
MEKTKFIAEYELRSSPKVLFPYLSTASGLEQWFSEKVLILSEGHFDFQWDSESHLAKQVAMRLNKMIKFEFTDTSPDNADNNYLEFRIEVSELTQATYLKVVDYSTNSDVAQVQSLWDGLMDNLKDIVGN